MIIKPPKLYRTFLTFLSEKFEAFCLLAISSNCGCRHVPVTGVDGVTGLVVGVVGVDVIAVDMIDGRNETAEYLSSFVSSNDHRVECQQSDPRKAYRDANLCPPTVRRRVST